MTPSRLGDGLDVSATSAKEPTPKLRWWRYLLGTSGLGVLAGVAWFLFSPRTVGILDPETNRVAYQGSDDPAATVAAVYVLAMVVAGLLSGLPAVGIVDRHVTTRTMVLVASGLPAALVAYLAGFLLGPATVAAQHAAGAQGIQVPVVLPSALLALTWPAATATMVSVGLLLSMLIMPPRPPESSLKPSADAVLSPNSDCSSNSGLSSNSDSASI